jgi:hypothetical protein
MTTPSSSSQAALTPDAAFSLERWSASSGSDRTSRASLVLVGGGRRWYAHANGNGAIDALCVRSTMHSPACCRPRSSC